MKEIRTSKKISQAALAEAVGKSQSTVASWENGSRKPLIDEIISLASIFDCSADYLLGCEEEKKETPPSPDGIEGVLLEKYRLLTPDQRKQAESYLDFLIASQDKQDT